MCLKTTILCSKWWYAVIPTPLIWKDYIYYNTNLLSKFTPWFEHLTMWSSNSLLTIFFEWLQNVDRHVEENCTNSLDLTMWSSNGVRKYHMHLGWVTKLKISGRCILIWSSEIQNKCFDGAMFIEWQEPIYLYPWPKEQFVHVNLDRPYANILHNWKLSMIYVSTSMIRCLDVKLVFSFYVFACISATYGHVINPLLYSIEETCAIKDPIFSYFFLAILIAFHLSFCILFLFRFWIYILK